MSLSTDTIVESNSTSIQNKVSSSNPLTSNWHIVKRDGRTEKFQDSKIRNAIFKCLYGIDLPYVESEPIVNRITSMVINVLVLHKNTSPTVEEVQRIVIQQLWADGQFTAAEHYTIYRENRRIARENIPLDPEQVRLVAEDAARFPNPIQYYQLVSKFARWRYEDNRRETWKEVCQRVMRWFHTLERVKLYDNEWQELHDSLYNLETSCAMRVVQMAGPALERCNVGVYNCAYLPLSSLRSFSELLYILMQGTGCGFSVEDQYISQLPRIKHQLSKSSTPDHKYIRTFIIPDSTEGWCDALLFGLESWFDGYDVIFDLSLIRPKGAILRTKGGRSSGPDPLYNMLMFVRNIILSRQGKILTDLNCHDIACMIGKIVQVGGVRRAATISFSDLESTAIRDCKSGNWYKTDVQRTMANNSAVYDERPDIDIFMSEFSALIKSKSGERGIFNLKATLDGMPGRRERRIDIRANPCSEIQLRPFQFCNLSIVVARPNDTRETLMKKVRLATYWGCMQKTATNFNYINPEWKKNCEEEALIGVDITGHADCPLLRFGAPGRDELLRDLRDEVDRVDQELSSRFGVNRSAANTCVKPSGDSAVFFNCASGCSPWFNDYILRYVREQAGSPVAILLESEGVPCAIAPEDLSLKVFGFLIKAPKGATKREDMTALDQLNNWLEWKENWAEHSVSCTVYVSDDEWPDVVAWCWKNFNKISGLSFLPRDNGVYSYAPNTAITKEQYDEMLKHYPTINWAKLAQLEKEDNTTTTQTYACTGPNGCTI